MGPTTRVRRHTDAEGVDYTRERGTIIDPTENVKALAEAGAKRQDDLRAGLEALITLRFLMLEKSVDARFVEIEKLVNTHNESDKDAFSALRRELNQHNIDDTRQHENILAQSSERMGAMKDLLTASIVGVTSSNEEVKKSVTDLRAMVVLNQTQSVSTDTYNEFKRGVETRERTFNDYMLSNQGERSGMKNFWGLLVGAAVGGAALLSMFQFIGSHLGR